MADNNPSQTGSEIEAAPNATEGPTQTSIPILDDSTTSLPVKAQRTSCLKVACRVLSLLPLLIIAYVITSTGSTLVLLLLIMFFVAITLVQFIRHGGSYDKATQLKFVIRFWIFIYVVPLLSAVGLAYPIAIYVKIVKHVILVGLSIGSWLNLIATLFTLYIFDFVINTFLHLLPPIPLNHDQSGLDVQEKVFEIVDLFVFLLAESIVINRVTWFKQQTILGLHTWKWIMVLILVGIGHNALRLFTHLGAWLLRTLVCEKLDSATGTHPHHQFLVNKLLPREYMVYYANGLKRSINFILSTLLILSTWVLYFGPRLSKTPQSDWIMRFGTRTFLSLLICSVSWLFKTWVVLSWEAISMYDRLRFEILRSGKQLYFLGILGRHSHDILKLTYYGPLKRKPVDVSSTSAPARRKWAGSDYLFELTELYGSYMKEMKKAAPKLSSFSAVLAYISCILELTSPDFYNRRIGDKEEDDNLGKRKDDQHRVKKLSAKKRKTTNHDLLMRNRIPTTHDVKQITQYLISAKTALSDDTFVSSIMARLTVDSDIREKLMQLLDDESYLNDTPYDPSVLPKQLEKREFFTRNSSGSPIDDNMWESSPEHPVRKNDWEYFEQEVLENQDCSGSSESAIRTWLETAQNKCFFLANALSSTKEMVDCLKKIVSGLLVGATFLVWLLLTGLATTKVLILIASPLLAATFIFGDTCKTLFKGIMYVYVVHPLHVGDLCSIDDKKMVVKAVGVWTTTFCRVERLGTVEEVTYPNSELANKVVSNHLIEFDWDDRVEISLGSLQRPDAIELKKKIEVHLNKRRDCDQDKNKGREEFVSCSHDVVVQGEEADFKIIIQLQYTISDIQEWSYFKCLRQKIKLKAGVDDLVRKFEEELKQLHNQN